ncbi:MAG TPA: hypothetical protein PL092_02390 [Candidatus Pacearchaeota archaeon]|nr:hypothetical protein [Candidatus Pacearchaeota archaeon]
MINNCIILDKYISKKTNYIIIFFLFNDSVSNPRHVLSKNDKIIRKYYFITED